LLAREEAEIKRRMEKEAKEAEERIALYKLQEQELHMKQIQWSGKNHKMLANVNGSKHLQRKLNSLVTC
jgi:hypothetical protein